MCEGLTAAKVWEDMKRRPPHEQPPHLRATLAAERLRDGAESPKDWEAACRAALTLLEADYPESAKKLLQLALSGATHR